MGRRAAREAAGPDRCFCGRILSGLLGTIGLLTILALASVVAIAHAIVPWGSLWVLVGILAVQAAWETGEFALGRWRRSRLQRELDETERTEETES